MNELGNYRKEPNPALLQLGPVDESEIRHWEAVMNGVPGSAYEKGQWKLDIQIPETYPNQPPKVSFVTPICHPNVHFKTGEICLDLLKGSWTPAYTISSTLGAIHQMLTYPEPESPLNVDVAKLLRDGDLIGAEGLVRWCCDEWRYNAR